MANKDGPSAVNFQSDQGNVEFQQDQSESGGGITERLGEAAQSVNWNKVAVGAGAAAAVAGAAYAATKIVGRGSAEGGEQSSGSSGKKKDR